MPLNEKGIRAELTKLVARWSVKEGNERQEAQTFLIELFTAVAGRLSAAAASVEPAGAAGVAERVLAVPADVDVQDLAGIDGQISSRDRPEAARVGRTASGAAAPAHGDDPHAGHARRVRASGRKVSVVAAAPAGRTTPRQDAATAASSPRLSFDLRGEIPSTATTKTGIGRSG
jgi:hypothetical protein